MITLTDYGVKLVQLTEDKIELVRQWRNSDKIKKYMEYRDYISPEMQQKWFNKISNTTNDFFFIIIDCATLLYYLFKIALLLCFRLCFVGYIILPYKL